MKKLIWEGIVNTDLNPFFQAGIFADFMKGFEGAEFVGRYLSLVNDSHIYDNYNLSEQGLTLEYSKKLSQWRERKVKNLANELNKYVTGKFVADIGGRSTDFAEQILLLNKHIKKFYVTDISLFSSAVDAVKLSSTLILLISTNLEIES